MTAPTVRSTLEQANARAERIRQGLESYHVLREDIAAAYLARDWQALGYPTWDQYVEAEFTSARLALPREERRELVAYFREHGMSTRAIAAATGVARNTVKDDLRQVGQIDPPDEERSTVVGIDGKAYTSRQPEPEVVDAEIVADESIPSTSATVTPREAQTRPILQREPQRRRPITAAADDAGWEIRKAAERVARLLDDDRFPKNEEQVALSLRGHLLFVTETVADALNKLDNVTPSKG